jgi:hypothetical protein
MLGDEMKYIDPIGIRPQEEIVKVNGILHDLNAIGDDTSLYTLSLLDKVTNDDLYILTRDGKIRTGGIRCLKTGQRDKVIRGTVKIVIVPKYNCFMFVATMPDGTEFDARGQYARTSLKIIRKRD